MKDPTLFAVVHAGIWLHPKLRHLAQDLDVEDVTAVGHLVSLWTAALAQAPDGVLHRWRPRDVADLSRWRGSADAFVGALLEHGWLEQDEQGVFVVAGWCEYAGRGLTERAKELDRKKRYREKQKDGPRDGNGTSPETPANTKRDVREEREREREREREQEKESESAARRPPAPAVALPAVVPEPEVQPDPPPSTEQRLERRESAAVVRSGYRTQIAGSRAAAGATLGRPQTVDELLALHVVESPDGRVSVVPDSAVTLQQVWRSRYGALDGKGNPRRPSIAEVLERVWPSSLNKGWDLSGSQLLAWWSGILSTEANRVRLAWEKDGGVNASGTHPLWAEWRNLRNSRDMPPFEEWLAQREREPAQQVGSGRRPQGPASGATSVARVVTAVLDEQVQAAAAVFNDEAGYSSGLAMVKAANARATTTTTTKTTKPGVLQ